MPISAKAAWADWRCGFKTATIDKRSVWAWAFYDFANSPFATTIISVIFNVYFAGVVAANSSVRGAALWSFLVAVSTLVSGALSPYVGAVADIRRSRKAGLCVCALVGSVSTAALAVSAPDTLVLSAGLFFIASVAFTLSLTFYNSFLNELSDDTSIGRISGYGWALGYLGGGLCLALNLWMIRRPDFFGIPAEHHWPVRAAFMTAGAWWFIFTFPLILFVPESGVQSQPAPGILTAHRMALDRLAASIRSAFRMNKNLFIFLAAYLLYNDAIETVIVTAAIFAGLELNMGQDEIIGCFLMIQFVAVIGAAGFGVLSDRWNHKRALQIALVVWAGILCWTFSITDHRSFWFVSAAAALVLGGSQSVSRSLFGRMVPDAEKTQFYGFLSLSGKISAAAGPALFGAVYEFTGNIRLAILTLIVPLLVGLFLLNFVREPVRQK